jgi:hypothetical protein
MIFQTSQKSGRWFGGCVVFVHRFPFGAQLWGFLGTKRPLLLHLPNLSFQYQSHGRPNVVAVCRLKTGSAASDSRSFFRFYRKLSQHPHSRSSCPFLNLILIVFIHNSKELRMRTLKVQSLLWIFFLALSQGIPSAQAGESEAEGLKKEVQELKETVQQVFP